MFDLLHKYFPRLRLRYLSILSVITETPLYNWVIFNPAIIAGTIPTLEKTE